MVDYFGEGDDATKKLFWFLFEEIWPHWVNERGNTLTVNIRELMSKEW